MINKGLFITGTDTDVGKTYIGAQIVARLHDLELDVVPRKPIESGCECVDGSLHPDDANKYYEAIQKKYPLTEICPFRFEPAISPQRAARLVNKPISVQETKQACLANVNEENFLVVEGAGGFYSPLCENGLNADLAETLRLPVLLVANDQLGCINHILLTVEAIQQRGLTLNAIVLNNRNAPHDKAMNNQEDLQSLLNVPIFAVANNEAIKSDSPIVNFIVKLLR